jgi:hypothetical protein
MSVGACSATVNAYGGEQVSTYEESAVGLGSGRE